MVRFFETHEIYIIGCFADVRDDRAIPRPDPDLVPPAALTFVGLGVFLRLIEPGSSLRERVFHELGRRKDVR